LFAVASVLLMMFVFSGVQPYHFRFPGLDYSRQDRLRLLTDCERENREQECFERQMAAYHNLATALGIPKLLDEVNKEAQRGERRDEEKLKRDAQRLEELLSREPVRAARQALLEKWTQLEAANRVLPVRIPPPAILKLLAGTQINELPVTHGQLIPIEQVQFERDQPVV